MLMEVYEYASTMDIDQPLHRRRDKPSMAIPTAGVEIEKLFSLAWGTSNRKKLLVPTKNQ